MRPSDQLVDLAKRAEHKLSEVFDAPEVLPFASKAIDLVASFPALREDFEHEFRTMRVYAPKEFVQVCIHALRWPKLRSFFEEQSRLAVARNDWSAIADYGKYLDAFEDDWEDARTFYGRYFVEAAND
ncbi:hypothetical protein ACSFBF_13220 [Variovorax sp. ZT5P49]|uniref:hypothetical protein n=1 Tax=Variovorax sp. ZT5P49 TaxID=3443733 RepID=UPI003F460F9F